MKLENKNENLIDKSKRDVLKNDALGLIFGISLAWLVGASGILTFVIFVSIGVLMAKKMLKSKREYMRTVFFLLLTLSFLGGIIMKEAYKDMRLDSLLEENQYQQIETDKNYINEEMIGNLYRNKKYGFRIKFPKDWSVGVGDGKHIVQKAVSINGDTISILIFQFDIGNQQGIKSIKDSGTAEEFINSAVDGARDKFSDIKILDYGETKIDNHPAYWVEYLTTYSALGVTVKTTNLIYYLAKGDIMYSISAGTESGRYLGIKEDILSSVGTFVLEN